MLIISIINSSLLYILIGAIWMTHAMIDEENYVFSCMVSSSVNPPSVCKFVTWNYARAFNKSIYSLYANNAPISISKQDTIAGDLLTKFNIKENSKCYDSAQRFICTQIFPECPRTNIGMSTSYMLPCRLQCQLATLNGCKLPINCNSYPSSNCAIYVPSGYFALDPVNVSH